MGRVKKYTETNVEESCQPVFTPEARENQLIALAERLAEQQLRDGTASPTTINHYLKLGAMRERDRLEKELLEKQVQLASAKTEAIQSTKRSEELFEKAILAMKEYSGMATEDDDFL